MKKCLVSFSVVSFLGTGCNLFDISEAEKSHPHFIPRVNLESEYNVIFEGEVEQNRIIYRESPIGNDMFFYLENGSMFHYIDYENAKPIDWYIENNKTIFDLLERVEFVTDAGINAMCWECEDEFARLALLRSSLTYSNIRNSILEVIQRRQRVERRFELFMQAHRNTRNLIHEESDINKEVLLRLEAYKG